MLDWSESILVAAFFAIAYRPCEGNSAIWALIPSKLNEMFLGKRVIPTMEQEQVQLLARAASGKMPPTREVLAVLPSEVDLRMTLQAGRFTIHGDATPLEQRARSDEYLAKIVIPEVSKAEMLEDMKCLGINRASLFPDLVHLAEHVAAMNFVSPDAPSLGAEEADVEKM